MQLESFEGSTLPSVLARIREVLGEDAMIVRTSVRRSGSRPGVRVVAGARSEIDRLRRRIEPSRPESRSGRSLVVSFLGPAGSGTTTTMMKLALEPERLGEGPVGILTLDTYRAGALDLLHHFAEIAGIPAELAYRAADAPEARNRLEVRGVKTILVDCPGRAPNEEGRDAAWVKALRALKPDEKHLTLSSGLRLDVVRATRELFHPCGPSHLLLTKADQIPSDETLPEVIDSVGLPIRWITDGPGIPGNVDEAAPRILRSLGDPTGSADARATA